jgi:VWFA-related protein
MKNVLILLVIAAAAVPCNGDSLVYVRVHRDLIEAQLKLAPKTDAGRTRMLHSLFGKGGCQQVIEQRVPEETEPNVICILRGREARTIVVAASPSRGNVAGDWPTLTLLPLLAESFALVPRRYTIMLVAFTGKENHNRGAKWFVDHLSEEQRQSIHAVVDLDDLGRAPRNFGLAQTDRTLATWMNVAAETLGIASPIEVDEKRPQEFWAAARPFIQSQIPAVALRSDVNAPGDTGAALNLDSYEDTYKLLCVYVLYLDRNLDRPLVEAGTYTGKIIDTEGLFTESPVDASARIDRFTTTGELNRFELMLQKGGQDGLVDAVSAAPDVGILRFGLQLAISVKIAVLQTRKNKTPYVLLVAPRTKERGATVRDFRFTVVRLDLDGNGRGEGQFYSTAKLRFRNHELEIEDFGSKPELIRQVRLEPPQPENAAPTEVAANLPPVGRTTAATSVQNAPTAQNAPVPAAQAPSEAAPAATFRAQARLVQVDVSATDSQGRPVTGLSAADFTVLEDGKPQPIRVFDSHVPVTKTASSSQPPPVPAPAPSLPPNTYSNKVVAPGQESLGILLLDLMNTPINDQQRARKQTIEFLKTLPPGQRISMFVLSGHLVQVQGFTGDSGTLVANAQKILSDRSLLLTTEAERQNFLGSTETVGRVATPALPAGAPAGALDNAGDSGLDFGHVQARERSNAMMEADRMSQRVSFTLDALTALARSVAGYPGRKNLIWLSGSFPIRLKPGGVNFYRLNSANSSSSTGLIDTPDFQPQVRAAATALAAARVAVYPVDVRGVLTAGVDLSVGAADSASFTGSDNPSAYSQNLNVQSESRFQERSAMKEVAEQTGGELLAGNDIKGVITRGLADGSTYYTLGYTPARDDSDPAFRQIEVKVNRAGVRLAYRPGYYPNTNQTAPKVHPLVVALQPGMPPSTMLPITVRVLPPAAAGQKFQINYTIDISAVDFSESADHNRHAALDVLAVAFKKDGTPAAQASNTVQANMTSTQYENALRNGLPVHQEIDLPPGQYELRIGVMDRATQKIGTLEAPVTAQTASAAK